MNFSSTLANIISFELFIVIHSLPVCIMCMVILSDWISSSFFQLNSEVENVGCFIYPQNLSFLWLKKKVTSRIKIFAIFFILKSHYYLACCLWLYNLFVCYYVLTCTKILHICHVIERDTGCFSIDCSF